MKNLLKLKMNELSKETQKKINGGGIIKMLCAPEQPCGTSSPEYEAICGCIRFF